MEEKDILEFITRRWHNDTPNARWTLGNCYWFAVILCTRFVTLQIYYNPIDGHFVAGNGKHFYDWNGRYTDYKKLIKWSQIVNNDRAWAEHLERDCIL